MFCVFVTPPLDGPATGGTLYNQQLLAAIGRLPGAELSFAQYSLEALPARVQPEPEQVWVDSLYLAELPALRARFEAGTRVGILLHYLPSLLTKPPLRAADELSESERSALQSADMLITPSEYLRQLVLELCPGKPCACVSPGVEVAELGGASVRDGSALMVCNVTENKGVLAFLRELARVVPATAGFRLEIVGSLQLEAAYARQCLELCQADPWLRAHVSFVGSVPQRAGLERLARVSLLVSASRMESYGMALAEARASGTPVVALAGGNVVNMVAAASGGVVADTARALAEAVCSVLGDAGELRRRITLARAAACVRPWGVVAREFAAAAETSR